MSDRAKRTSWIVGILASLAAIFALVGSAAGHWSDLQSRVTSVEVRQVEESGRLSRLEIRIDARMARMDNKLDRLLERD